MTSPIILGAEPWSHVGDSDSGAMVLHGFTGNPSSMRGVAEAWPVQACTSSCPCYPVTAASSTT